MAKYLSELYTKYKNVKGRKRAWNFLNKDNSVVVDGKTFWLEIHGDCLESERNAIIEAIKKDYQLNYLYD